MKVKDARESMFELKKGSFVMCLYAVSSNVLETGKVYKVLRSPICIKPAMEVYIDVGGIPYSFSERAFTGDLDSVHVINIDHMDDEEIFMLRLSV